MSKLGDELIEAMGEVLADIRGGKKLREHIVRVEIPDVKAIRDKLGLSQDAFAETFHVSPATVRNWEQGRRRPEGPALALLTVIDREPRAARRALVQAASAKAARTPKTPPPAPVNQ